MQTSGDDRRLLVSYGLLAGGESKRMQRDKAQLPWVDGRRFVNVCLDTAQTAGFRQRLLSTPREVSGIDPDVLQLPDRLPGLGPMGGVMTLLEAAGSQKVLIVSVDTPQLSPAVLEEMARTAVREDAETLPLLWQGRLQPFICVYDKKLLPKMRERVRSGYRSIWPLLSGSGCCPWPFLGDGMEIESINTPKDLEEVTSWYSRKG